MCFGVMLLWHDSRAFVNYWVSGYLKGVVCLPFSMHVLVVLLCSACIFLGSLPISPHFCYIHTISLLFIHPVGSPLFFYFSGTSSRVGAGLGSFWQSGLMAGLQMGQAFRCSSYLALRSGVPALHVPVHPTSTWNECINS